MFDALQENLGAAFKTLRGQGKLSEANMRDGLKLVEKSLLEADVSYEVARAFMKRVSDQALGEKVLQSLRPSEQVIGIVYQELVNLMGPVDHSLHLKGKGEVTVLMMCGLQGSGKTTTCGKLGRLLKQSGRKPLLVAADLQRPAAIDQLHVLGEQLDIPVYSDRTSQDPVKVTGAAVEQAKRLGADVVILDTAGRLHIDNELMDQLKRVDSRCSPDQVYLVVDGMTGQDAVNSAKAFNEALELDGVIMTKLDGDARGGAAISVKEVTGVPLKFMGTGEHLENLEPFHPERMAGRILGQGDMMSLVEKAQQEFDQDEARRLEEQLSKGEFSLDDFLKQMQQIKRLGPLRKVMGMIPGMSQLLGDMDDVDAEGDLRRLQGIIHSMTPAERRKPKLIDHSRRRRIASGAGVEPHAVNELVKQFDAIAPMMTAMAGKGMGDRMKMVKEVQAQMMGNPAGQLGKKKQSTGKRLTAKEKAKAQRDREKRLKQLRKNKGR
ncbi:signal recognition particle protein [Botrimarina hoheduenensis]|uniref:Signal recognition particle protein n=1 Tax=Botrimarina hoheduenensis TaxID=2528000 RepID=A0A5C5WA77_9BACT|nr:signal recognition particle protein [Botrimarina hoheduenensis]TWT47786.1 Signal recognition particle protein [Botrimarina hoheduenensis]